MRVSSVSSILLLALPLSAIAAESRPHLDNFIAVPVRREDSTADLRDLVTASETHTAKKTSSKKASMTSKPMSKRKSETPTLTPTSTSSSPTSSTSSSSSTPITTSPTSERSSSSTTSSSSPAFTSSLSSSDSISPSTTPTSSKHSNTGATSIDVVTKASTVSGNRPTSGGSRPSSSSSASASSEPGSDGGSKNKGGHLSNHSRKVVIGVVVGVCGAIAVGAVSFAIWRIRRRSSVMHQADEDDLITAGTALGSSSHEMGSTPFQTNLDQYHAAPLNTASNF